MDKAKTIYIYYAVLFAIKFTSGENPCLSKTTQCLCSNDRVDCSNGNITAIPSKFPSGTKQMNLFENNISYIESKTFSSMPALEDIILNNNRIRELLPLTFLELESLYDIYLENNQLSVIHPRAFEKLPKLGRIYLAGNRLHCTCAIKWFVAYLNGNPNLFNRTSASCSSPTTVVQKKVALLNASNLQCVLVGSLLALFFLLFTYAALKGR
uniref:Peroxidasin-like protein n=1 Tax=Magallana gigas TaxID=29159 RepID=K1PK51_MAGGI